METHCSHTWKLLFYGFSLSVCPDSHTVRCSFTPRLTAVSFAVNIPQLCYSLAKALNTLASVSFYGSLGHLPRKPHLPPNPLTFLNCLVVEPKHTIHLLSQEYATEKHVWNCLPAVHGYNPICLPIHPPLKSSHPQASPTAVYLLLMKTTPSF